MTLELNKRYQARFLETPGLVAVSPGGETQEAGPDFLFRCVSMATFWPRNHAAYCRLVKGHRYTLTAEGFTHCWVGFVWTGKKVIYHATEIEAKIYPREHVPNDEEVGVLEFLEELVYGNSIPPFVLTVNGHLPNLYVDDASCQGAALHPLSGFGDPGSQDQTYSIPHYPGSPP